MNLADLDPTLMLAPFLLLMLGLGLIAWIAMMGGSLQFSLWLTMDQPPGFLKSLLIAFLIVVINIAIFVGFFFAFGPQPWYIIACYQVMLQIFLVMLLARCNPVSAFFAAFAHAFFSSIGTVVLALVLMLTCGSAMRDAMERKHEIAEQRGPQEVANPFVNE